MNKIYKSVILSTVSLFLISSFSFMGCTKHPNAEQLQALEEQKNAALSAEQTLEECRGEESRLQSELNQKRTELEETKAELAAVKERLGQ